MSKLVIALATATILIAGGAVRAEAATMTDGGGLTPVTKSYTPVEKAAYWRRYYRRGYYGYGYPYYGYGYYRSYLYYGYGFYRPFLYYCCCFLSYCYE